jgi:hypothetical protein
MKLEKWLKEVKPKVRSKLDPMLEEIATLRERGYTQLQIVEFLKSNGIKTSQTNISFFLYKKVKNKPKMEEARKLEKELKPKEPEVQKPKTEEPKQTPAAQEKSEPKTTTSEEEDTIKAQIDYIMSHGPQKSEAIARLKERFLALKDKN